MQIRAENGASFIDFTGTEFPGSHTQVRPLEDECQVEWHGRIWIHKEKDITLNEVAGYQMAGALGLPLQPWIAFFRRGADKRHAGMLIERWKSSAFVNVWWPAKQRPELVAPALALCVFDRFEWPVWLVSPDRGEFRLIDLERIGPNLAWPPQRIKCRDYRRTTVSALREAHETANKNRLDDRFDNALRNLLQLDLAPIIDFSGHPNGKALGKALLRGLEARQSELRRIIDGINPPRRTRCRRTGSALLRRKREITLVGVRHPQHGWLSGRIELRPAPRGRWNVRWDIGTMDYDMRLSSQWFAASEYAEKLSRSFDDLEREMPKLRLCSYGGVRWGYERNIDEQSARRLVASVKQIWRQILENWQKPLMKKSHASECDQKRKTN